MSSAPAIDLGDIGYVEPMDDAAIDRWHDGWLDAYRSQPKATDDPDYLKGYAEGADHRAYSVVSVERPEGYYHMPLGTFD